MVVGGDFLVNKGAEQPKQQRNFFTDFHGLQAIQEKSHNTASLEKHKLARLHNHFLYKCPDPGLKCILYMERVKRILGEYFKEVPPGVMQDFLELCLLQTLRDLSEGKKSNKILRKLPRTKFETVIEDLQLVVDNLPPGFFQSKPVSLEGYEVLRPQKPALDLIFYIPLTEDDPCIEDSGTSPEITMGAAPSINTYYIKTRYEDHKAQMGEFPFEEFKEIVQAGLNGGKSDEELLNYFLDVFGAECFEFLGEIIANRQCKIDWGDEQQQEKQDNFVVQSRREPRNRYTPAMASQVIVQSEEEKNRAKFLRKIEKKQRNMPNTQEDVVSEMRDDLNYVRTQPIFKRGADVVEYPHVHDQLRNLAVSTKFNGVTFKHPENTIKKETATHVEFTIPASKSGSKDDLELVQVDTLDATGRMVFKDIKRFNRIQSEVFPVAYNTNQNMLICAPTGGGKTNIALLAIVHQIKAHMDGGMIRRDDFKIVYVCPMKALATEMVANFGKKLAPIGITVKELTGDMQLTRREIADTQMLVTTPEKWDVISRKGAVDTEVTSLVKLLILDEVHLLNSNRGPVIEALVARTLRQVLSSQSIIRIVALSATLPGYLDVAAFLKVNPSTGLFFFDNRFRSIPLAMTFIGMKTKNDQDAMDLMCYKKLSPIVKEGHQVMVFVTSRNMTTTVAKNLLGLVRSSGDLQAFAPEKTPRYQFKSGDLEALIPNGFGVHHAGMCRGDRIEVEGLFRQGVLKVIVCTTTLAWGVNLPAHAVIIRGTTRYDPQRSAYVDMDMLDVMQIFGRAGRPQYDTSGHGMILTGVTQMTNYMTLLTSQTPIESQFLDFVPDNLNAEVVLGTVSNVKEAMEWLSNTFVYCRIKKNPLNYGLTLTDVWDGDKLFQHLEQRLYDAATKLDATRMIRFDKNLGELRPTNYGRIASFYYISHKTMDLMQTKIERNMLEADIMRLLAHAYEFEQIQVRNDELDELERLHREYSQMDFHLDPSDVVFKVLTLMQTNISRGRIWVSSLLSDCEYIMQCVQRLARALFEIAADFNYSVLTYRALQVAQSIEQQMWPEAHPLLQFKELELRNARSLQLIEKHSMEELAALKLDQLCDIVGGNKNYAARVQHLVRIFPRVKLDVSVKPITQGVLRIQVMVLADFTWDTNHHGNVQHYYIWVEDLQKDTIYHMESFVVTRKQVTGGDMIELTFTVPLEEPHSTEYFVSCVNSKFMACDTTHQIDLDKIKMLQTSRIQTKFLNVRPVPLAALHDPTYMQLYPNFTHFNAVQSQLFHTCYNSDVNVLLGAPTGSGKTIVAELCALRLFRTAEGAKVVYIAPMKALVRERVRDWLPKFAKIGKRLVEVTGDVTPDARLLARADLIVTTPEKWDGMSRSWAQKDFVKKVGLVIIDEIHLLAEERGPVLEIIVSRMNYINTSKNEKVRIVGLSTAMANAADLANWLGCTDKGLYNFSSSVRPVPLEIHLQGFSARNYCPRMATMNRPAYQAICQYAPTSPTLIFVSSRKQTRITSYELIKNLLADTNPQAWLHTSTEEIESIRSTIIDSDLAYLLLFGIGIHHAGLQESDREQVERLFVSAKIQVLVATATLAWGVNFPAHLVIVKGTEYYDGATKRYVDMPVTDVLQMLGRAGRPQFDTSGVACVFVQENKKNFYRKFLFEPFPVESSLLNVLHDHVNAEICNGTIACRPHLIEFICSTFFFRRLLANPAYYKMEDWQDPNAYLDELAAVVVGRLVELGMVAVTPGESGSKSDLYESTFLGQIAAQYYLNCKSVTHLARNMTCEMSMEELLQLMCEVEEYALFPVRHNEDKINRHLSQELALVRPKHPYDSPHLKVYLLLKCYLSNKPLPNQEYVVDLKTVFDQIVRIVQAMISMSAERSWLDTTLKLCRLNQMFIQGHWLDSNSAVHAILGGGADIAGRLATLLKQKTMTLSRVRLLVQTGRKQVTDALTSVLGAVKSEEVVRELLKLPLLRVALRADNQRTTAAGRGIVTVVRKSDERVLLEFDVRRDGPSSLNVQRKRFGKQKEESWMFVMAQDMVLIKMQRFVVRHTKTVMCEVETPQEPGNYMFDAYFISDSYIGLDQRMTVRIVVE